MKINTRVIHLFHLISLLNEKSKKNVLQDLLILDDRYRILISGLVKKSPLSIEELLSRDYMNSMTNLDLERIVKFIENSILRINANYSDILLPLFYNIETPEEIRDYFFLLYEKTVLNAETILPNSYLAHDLILRAKSFQLYKSKDKYPSQYFGHEMANYFMYNQLCILLFYFSDIGVHVIDKNKLISEFEKLKLVFKVYETSVIEIKILYLTIELIITNEKEIFDEISNLIKSNKIKIADKELNNISSILINSIFLNLSIWGYSYSDILAIFKTMHKYHRSIFYQFIQPQYIKNMATLCIRCNEIDWFLTVFNSKETELFSPINRDALKLCKAKFLQHSKKYKECIGLLNQFKTHDIFQELELRRLQLMCFYELKERVLVDNYANTFKIFIYRNKEIQNIYKESNNNFIRLINRINKTIDLSKLNAIKEEIDKTERISEKQWLIEKVKELNTKLSEIH